MGVHYASVQQRRPADFAHPATLPAAIRLPGGRIECTTCHSLTSGLGANLVIDHRRGALCLACHQM